MYSKKIENRPKVADFLKYQTSDITKNSTDSVSISYFSNIIPSQMPINPLQCQSFSQIPINYCPSINSLIPKRFINFSEYKTDMGSMKAEQIKKRMLVIKNFLFYKKQTIEAILRHEIVENLGYMQFSNIILYLKDVYCSLFECFVSAGFWHEIINEQDLDKNYCFGFDIISLHTFLLAKYNRKYSQSVEEIFDYFSSKNFINRSDSFSSKEFYVQEKNPISLSHPVYFDRFFEKFNVKDIVVIKNINNRTIGCVWDIKTEYEEHLEIYFTFWRHKNSSIFSLYPIHPEKPYDVYFLKERPFSIGKTKDVLLCGSITDLCSACINNNNKTPALIVNGLLNILCSDFSAFSGCNIYFKHQDIIDYTSLKLFKAKFKENNITACFVYIKNCEYRLDEVIECPEKFGFKRPVAKSLIATPDETMQNEDRVRTMILDPIIESGTITWLFAPEKAGKTLLALTIAQAVGMGNISVGAWRSREPKKVLYIDGEMPADKLSQHIKRITRGLSGGQENSQRAFSIYLFGEEGWDYENILDPKWQDQHIDEVMAYDLIILDNYYTLYENLNPIRFILWMKKLTRLNKSFLVIDHTNADGELQGSQVKKRAMDLGLKLELLEKNKICLDYHYDRYGKQYESEKFSLIPCFTTSEFSYNTQILKSIKINELDCIDVDDDIELVAILYLKQQRMKNCDVAKRMERSDGHISKALKKMGLDSDLRPIDASDEKNKLYNKIHNAMDLYLEKFCDVDSFIEYAKNKSKK